VGYQNTGVIVAYQNTGVIVDYEKESETASLLCSRPRWVPPLAS